MAADNVVVEVRVLDIDTVRTLLQAAEQHIAALAAQRDQARAAWRWYRARHAQGPGHLLPLPPEQDDGWRP